MSAFLLAEAPLFGSNRRGIIIFGFEIYYYALCIVAGIIAATALSALLMKRRNMSPDFIFTLFIFCIPAALICARLYYCITDGMDIRYWFAWGGEGSGTQGIRDGGLSIIGGVIGGVGTGLVVCLVKKVSFFRAADCVVITILLAQAMGRWGNYFNQEVFGAEVTNSALQWFPFAVFIEARGEWHYAFFFYEMMINLVGFALLYTLAWKWTKKPNGLFVFAYCIWYGTVRSVMEPLRDPTYILQGGGVPWSFVSSILLIAGGVAGVVCLLLLNYRKEGALIGSKRGDPCGITQYLTPYKDDVPYYSKINILGANYPPKPEEETFRYKWGKFKTKVKGWFTREEKDPDAPTEQPTEPTEQPTEPTEQPTEPTERPENGQQEEKK